MKIKKIKCIRIGSANFDVIWDKESGGGHFEFPFEETRGYIKIGIKEEKVNPARVLEIIIHEVKEVIQYEQSTRFEKNDTRDAYEFHYNHKEHTQLCSELAGILNEFLI